MIYVLLFVNATIIMRVVNLRLRQATQSCIKKLNGAEPRLEM